MAAIFKEVQMNYNELFAKYKTILTVVLLSVMATIITILLLMLYAKNVKIENLEVSIQKCNLEKQNETNNNLTLHQVIRDLNDEKLKDSINYEKKKKELEQTKSNLIQQFKKQGGSNECQDIKNKLDSLRNTDYSRLLK